MDDEFFIFIMALCSVALIFTIAVLITSADSTPSTRNVQVCEITTTDTGTVERCWDEKEVVN